MREGNPSALAESGIQAAIRAVGPNDGGRASEASLIRAADSNDTSVRVKRNVVESGGSRYARTARADPSSTKCMIQATMPPNPGKDRRNPSTAVGQVAGDDRPARAVHSEGFRLSFEGAIDRGGQRVEPSITEP